MIKMIYCLCFQCECYFKIINSNNEGFALYKLSHSMVHLISLDNVKGLYVKIRADLLAGKK